MSAVLCLFMLLMPLVSANGEVIYLDGGGKLKGSIIDANANTVIVQRPAGGIQQIARKLIAEVGVDLRNGQKIIGGFDGWSNGVLRLETEAGLV
ncbi:MAG: hypothetical protein ACR2RA_24455, partial [Geminicoccaceae bacterium]